MRTLPALLLALLLLAGLPNVTATESGDGWIRGEGTCFEVTNSTYLNVTLCSAVVVDVSLWSTPGMVSYTIRSVDVATASNVTISGFVPGRTYYRHEEGHLLETFIADGDGGYAYAQDLSRAHHVVVAEQTSTLYIRDDATGGDCTSIGTWDGPSKTCTMTTNAPDVIVIDGNGITLDGAGKSIGGSAYSWHVYASGRSGITVRNTVQETCYGIGLFFTTGSTVSGNKINSCFFGMQFGSSSSNVVSGNDVWANWYGFSMGGSPSNTVDGNSVGGAAIALDVGNSHDNAISENFLYHGVLGGSLNIPNSNRNVITGNVIAYVVNLGGEDNVFEGNEARSSVVVAGTRNLVQGNSMTGWLTLGGTYNTAKGNTFSPSGIGLAGSYNTVEGNTISTTGSAVSMYGSSWHTIKDNTISGNQGISVIYSGQETITGNKIAVAGSGISLWGSCCGTIISENQITGGSSGIELNYYSQYNTVSNNQITDVQYDGITLGYYSWYNVVIHNSVSRAGAAAVLLSEIRGSTIASNLIANNGVGIRLVLSDGNGLFENCILDNAQQLSRYESGSNTWHNTARAPRFWGNHWSDYTGQDLDGDGIGDTKLPHLGFDQNPLKGPSMPNYGRVCAGNSSPLPPALAASSVAEGSATMFTATASDPENDPLTYSFDFEDDGAWDAVGQSNTAMRVWGDDHTGIARVRVCDAEFCMEDTVSVAVSNAVPQVTVTVGEAVEGSPLDVSFRITDPGSDDLTATLEWGEGVDTETYLVGVGPDPDESTDVNPRDVSDVMSHVYADDTHRVGTLTVADDDGGAVVVNFVLVVVNGEPQVTTATINDGNEAEPVAFTGAARDPGADDLTVCWDWDDTTSECRTYFNDGTFPFYVTDSGTHVWGDDATYDVVLTVTDDDGGSVQVTLHTVISNVAPSPSLTLDATSYFEGSLATASASFVEQGTDDVALTWMWLFGPTESETFYNNGVSPDPPKSPLGNAPFIGADAMIHTYDDDGVFSVTVEACDDDGGCASVTLPVPVQNLDPVAVITGPASGAVFAIGEPVTFSGAFTDLGTGDTHVADWTFDSTTVPGTVTETVGSGTVEAIYSFSVAGIYRVTLTVLDDDGGQGSASSLGDLVAFVVIFDSNDGYVTGGGWFPSPPGSFLPNPDLSGKASFGFVSKYRKGASVPTGETEFQFKVADFNFHSTSYDWLVCGGPKCQYKGHGTVNGVDGYSFMLTAIDGQLPGGGEQDRIRMKIWVTLTGQIVYDNQMGADDFADPTTVIGGGSIVIHRG